MNNLKKKKPHENLAELTRQSRQTAPERRALLDSYDESLHSKQEWTKASNYYQEQRPREMGAIEMMAGQLIGRVKQHQNYYMSVFDRGLKKYADNYCSMMRILNEEYERGLSMIQSQRSVLMAKFKAKRVQIKEKASKILPRDRSRKERADKRIQQLKKIAFISINTVDVQFPPFDTFQHLLQQYLPSIHFEGEGTQSNDQEDSFDSCSHCSDRRESVVVDVAIQTDAAPQSPEPQPGDHSLDEFLSCHQDISQKASPSACRRRKYAVVHRDVIREQEQFSDSSIVSEG